MYVLGITARKFMNNTTVTRGVDQCGPHTKIHITK
jgi:hypothetical protein